MADVTGDGSGLTKSVHTSDEAHRRLRRRYNFEWRFKAIGMAAIALAAFALIALLSTVLGNAVGAMRETYITIPVQLDMEVIGVAADADRDAIRRGNFDGLVRKSLRRVVSSATSRSDKRALHKLVSDGAALSLRQAVMENPTMLGQTQSIALLASDDADLWIKGYGDKFELLPSSGTATPVVTGEQVEIVVESSAFQTILLTIKQSLRDAATVLRQQAVAQGRGAAVFEGRLKNTSLIGEPRRNIEASLTGYRTQVADLTAKADALTKRAEAPGGYGELTTELPSFFVRINGGVVKVERASGDTIVGRPILPLQLDQSAATGSWRLERLLTSEDGRRVNDQQAVWLEELRNSGMISRTINWNFLSSSNSREAEIAGVWGAVVGSFWTMLVTFLLAFPVGVMAAIYLEEFAPKNGITDFIEVNINNLAAVPSIVFGLLGLAVFISFFGVPRSTAMAGGIVLALMTLPTIIIASRAAIKAVPPSIREAALGVGASKIQTVSHHVLPLAMPGIMTGTIIGMAQALGETAPLLMIGMFAFIREIPTGITEPATALPVQIYQWSDFPERLFEMKTAAAIVVLLLFLITMNALAILLRRRFERRW
ncbi:MAG: phosphate transport system permease protein [Hyphomicrobiaceae bacterium]|jgi:phosphate transport system permease protein